MGWLQKPLGGQTGGRPEEASDLSRLGAVLLDVREAAEWKAGHASSARNVPLGELGVRLDSLPRDRRLVVVCRSGGRSARATALLVRSGFDAVNLDGGMRAWAAAGLPVEVAAGRPGNVV